MITPKLADKLGCTGPREKYLLSTCGASKVTKFGRRIQGLSMQSMKGDTIQLPKLIECDSIPRDKREIPTPELVRKFPHLQEIAREIPPLDPKAQIHLLIGRDAPEILKVRAFKNGPKGHHGLTSYSWDGQFLVRSASIVWEAQFIFKRVEQFVSTETKGYLPVPLPLNLFSMTSCLVQITS
jgi:hypothetical protein